MPVNFENKRKALAHPGLYFKRIVVFSLFGAGFIFISLLIGAVGYMYFANLGWVDGFYNAAMILTGMGPAVELHTDSAKIFATIYSVYSGVAFLTSVGVIFAPVIHRFFHKMHISLPDTN
jgi:hypothetical protein